MTTVRIAMILVVGAVAGPGFAHSGAWLVSDPGSTVTVTLAFTVNTDLFGPLSGTDTDSAATSGTAQTALFPTDPPFTHAVLHSVDFSMGQLDFHYSFVFGLVQIDVTVTGAALDLAEPAFGTIGPSGDAFFPEAVLHMIGSARVVSSALGIDEILDLDDTNTTGVDARITERGGVVTLEGIVVPPFQGEADPAELPLGITSLAVDISVSTANVHLRGRHSPADNGDWDGDSDIDLDDFAALSDCLTGPDVPVSVYCTPFDFEDDADVDLLDSADFQEAFTGPSP
jgi:hypothetical protein